VKGPVGAANTEVARTMIVARAAENFTMLTSRLGRENEESVASRGGVGEERPKLLPCFYALRPH
jgi:hypothetical protein